MDTFGRISGGTVHGMSGPSNFHYAPFMEEMEAGLVEKTIPEPKPETQSDSHQGPQIYGSSTDVFS